MNYINLMSSDSDNSDVEEIQINQVREQLEGKQKKYKI